MYFFIATANKLGDPQKNKVHRHAEGGGGRNVLTLGLELDCSVFFVTGPRSQAGSREEGRTVGLSRPQPMWTNKLQGMSQDSESDLNSPEPYIPEQVTLWTLETP